MKFLGSVFRGLICAVVLAASPVFAQSVTLNSRDGTLTLTGQLKDFDGENYLIVTAVGEISISIDLVICSGDGCPNLVASVDAFTLAGSNVIGATLLPTLIEAYALERGGDLQIEFGESGAMQFVVTEPDGSVYSTITVMSGSSDDAFTALADGSALIGLSSRTASEAEIVQFASAGYGLLTDPDQERIIALDGVIAVVNRDNPVSALSLGQIAQIFSGEVTNWSGFGGLNAPIVTYRRDENSGTTAVFDEMAMAPNGQNFSGNSNILPTNAAVSDAVGRDLNGIGISSIADERNARAIAIRSVCGQIFVASDFTIKTEEYPLSRRMFLYTKSGPLPDKAGELIDFITSNLAQEVAENSGFVGQNVSRLSLDEQGRRIANAIVAENDANGLANLQNLLTTILDAERLSLTFRFISGTSTLDNRAIGDIERLSAMIQAGDFSNRQILVLGFTDNIGSADENARLSQARAELVRDAIIEVTGASNLGNIQITPIGYGNISPLDCNETPSGRQTNRRVELWIR
ncbi:MAG: substrate-binding domain-containing protein [Rhodobacteraceae bacterium]|nr:substrate-binding domain-containing protein [Paracoccaceae bacterium]